MGGVKQFQNDMFSHLSPEERVRKDHSLRAIRLPADQALREQLPVFDRMYSRIGPPSIPPERLLRAQLLQMIYSIRNEEMLMEEIDHSILCRLFVGMSLDEPIWELKTFSDRNVCAFSCGLCSSGNRLCARISVNAGVL